MKARRDQSPPASRQRNSPPPPVIPDDLMVEILSWLPVKSLVKFRCVCKSWKSLISDPNFVKLHLRRSVRNPSLLLVWERAINNSSAAVVYDLSVSPCSVPSLLENPSYTIPRNDCYPLNDYTCYDVVGCCNGLVCLGGDDYHNKFEYCFYLWNPATKCASKHLTDFAAHFYYRFAFGYDNLSDSYKVVAFRFDWKADEESEKIQVKIFSFGDNSWRSIHSFPVMPFDTYHGPMQNNGVYFNGTLNWLALCNIKYDEYHWIDTVTIAQLVIVSLDLGMETYTQLLLPHVDESPQAEPTIGILMDCLCFSHDCKGIHLVVWQMKEFGVEKSWTQFMKISYQDLQICLDPPFPVVPMCMSKDGEVLIMANIGEMQAILYYWRDNRIERVEAPKYICWSETKNYVESLVSPCFN